MLSNRFAWVCLAAALTLVAAAGAEERQITFSAKCHNPDNNDNFSPNCRYICYDTRGTDGHGMGNGQTIEMVEVATGKETVLYKPPASVIGDEPAPGIGAPFFSPVENKVAFIHGPLLDEVPARGYYSTMNRRGAEVIADGSGTMTWLDYRDIDTSRPTLPGAHRGGTHRHEYCGSGKRIGLTYNDFLLQDYDRTVGYLEKRPDAPGGATHWFAVLVPVVPKGTSKPGEIEKANKDSWVGRDGTMRSFIGKVRAADGESYEESLFVIDIPADVDITTAGAGSATEFPTPPRGVSIRRLTHSWAGGDARGSLDGKRIAYFAKAEDGTTQVFLIASDGSDKDPDPAKRPVQATSFPKGAGGAIRWHASGNSIACVSNNGIVVTCVKPGELFGKSVWLTPQSDEPERDNLCWSPDGKLLSFAKIVPTFDTEGKRAYNYEGEDFKQIFVVEFPDADADGIADTLK